MKTEITASEVLQLLKENHKTLSTAESCTGGLIGKLLTDVPGSSAVYLGGVISYTNAVKQKLLGVSAKTLSSFTAVSSETASEMALGVKMQTGSSVSVSVTGLAGPDGDGTGREVGLVYIAYCDDFGCFSEELHLHGSREEIRNQAAQAVFSMIYEHLA